MCSQRRIHRIRLKSGLTINHERTKYTPTSRTRKEEGIVFGIENFNFARVTQFMKPKLSIK